MDEGSELFLHRKKTIEHAQNKARLSFDVAHDLFSSFEIDLGTRLLLRMLAKGGWVGRPGRILDVGCGYGPIGVTLGALNPEARVTMTDRDLLAVRYAAHNAAANDVGLEGCVTALAYDRVPGLVAGDVVHPMPGGAEQTPPGPASIVSGYDLIVSNVPAKAGPAVIESIVVDSAHHLGPEGQTAVVVIDRVAPLVDELVEANATVVARAESRGYLALLYRPNPVAGTYRDGFERGLYDRETHSFSIGSTSFEARTVWGLPEFDTPAYSTVLAGQHLGRHLTRSPGSRVLFVNPGQGLLPAMMRATGPTGEAVLRSRDLLELRASERNARGLASVETELTIDSAPGETTGGETAAVAGVDLAVYRIPEDEPARVTEAAVRALRHLPSFIVHGRSTQVGRVAQALRLDGHERTRNRGSTSLWYRTGPRHRPGRKRR